VNDATREYEQGELDAAIKRAGTALRTGRPVPASLRRRLHSATLDPPYPSQGHPYVASPVDAWLAARGVQA